MSIARLFEEPVSTVTCDFNRVNRNSESLDTAPKTLLKPVEQALFLYLALSGPAGTKNV